MSEPRTVASGTTRVVPTVHRWRIADDRNEGAEADAYAVVSAGRVVLIDPLPLEPSALAKLGRVETIVLTAPWHQRSAWRLRRELGVHVFAPDGAPISRESGGLEEEPDQRYSGGDTLPGGLVAVHMPGPGDPNYALWLDRPRSVVFISDLLLHDGSGTPAFPPSDWLEEPARARLSVRRLLERIPIEVVCFGHGPPIVKDARQALERALALDDLAAAQPAAPV